MTELRLTRRLASEFIGTALLLAAVVGSGIMAEKLSGGNVAIALLCNTLATGAMLYVLIGMLGPLSGAHFNPAVTAVILVRREIDGRAALAYVPVQIAGGLLGVAAAHAMFDLAIIQSSLTARHGAGQWIAEAIATFGLIITILGTVRFRPENVPAAVGLYIVSAYWFTASTSFANPAVTIARSFSNTFAGIAPADVALFVVAQMLGALAGLAVANYLFAKD
jgi:glycerol uptake facilitator-like aquaporin